MIPGTFIAIITFPGVILHEFAHKFFCDITGVKVHKVCYFRFGNPAGYVLHEPVYEYRKIFLISIAPFILNSIIAYIIFLIGTYIFREVYQGVFYWLGISIAANSFPSDSDVDNLWEASKNTWKKNFLALSGFPVVILVKIANKLSFFWFDFFYACLLLLLAGGRID